MNGRDPHGNVTAEALAIAIRRLHANEHLLSPRCFRESRNYLWATALRHNFEHATARLVWDL